MDAKRDPKKAERTPGQLSTRCHVMMVMHKVEVWLIDGADKVTVWSDKVTVFFLKGM